MTTRAIPRSSGLRCSALLAGLLTLGLLGPAQAGIPIEPGLSGSWYDPARSGEGWQLEILSDSLAIVFWYSYPSADLHGVGEQLWVGGLGQIQGDRILIDPVQHFRGPRFGPGFSTAHLEQRDWGSMQIEFSSCTRATIAWQAPSPYGGGVREVQHLSANPRMPCGLPAPEVPEDPEADPPEDPRFPPPTASVPGLSGTWYDPTHSGEGWFVQEVGPGVIAAVWYTFDAAGNPSFLLGLGQLRGRSLRFPGVVRPMGARFGTDFDPADVERNVWGDMHLVLDSCTTGTLSYRSPLPGFGAGLLRPVRLSISQSLVCAFPPLADIPSGQWTQRGSAPLLSELPAAVLHEQIYVAGGFGGNGKEVWRFDPQTEAWTRRADLPQVRHHGQMAAHGDSLYFFGGFASSTGFGFVPLSNAWRYDPGADTWTAIASLPVPKGAGTALTHGDSIYLVGGEPRAGLRYEPAHDRWGSLTIDDPWPRDHSAAVMYEDEIWILGGRSHDGGTHNQVTIHNLLTGVSRPGPPMRAARSGFAATVLHDQILVGGGEDLISAVNVQGAEYYSPVHRAWRDAPPLPTAMHGVAAASTQDTAWFLLGSVAPGGVSNPGIVQSFAVPQPAPPEKR